MSYRLLLFRAYKLSIFAFCVVILNFAFCILNLEKAYGAAFSLSVDPPITFIQMVPDTEISTPITITNEGDDSIGLSIILKPFTAKNERGEVLISEEPLPISSSISLFLKEKPVNEIFVSPGESAQLTLRIGPLPQQNDSYFSIIFASEDSFVPKNLENKEQSDVSAFSQLKPAVATNVILSFKDESTNNLSWELKTKTFFESGPVDFMLKVTNNNKRAQPIQGTIFIQNLFGQTVGKIDLPSLYILAESSRVYPLLSWKEKFLLGPYTASLVIKPNVEDEEQALKISEIRFLALPYQASGLVTFIILILLIVIVRIRKKLHFS